MTYCVGIKIREGLVALADGRITAGTQLSSARKVTMMDANGGRFFVMSSGLRSVRDKTLAYLRRDLLNRKGADGHRTMLEVLNAFTACLRQVAKEDKAPLEASGLNFNLHALIGGQLLDDPEPYMYLIYPEGNWIEVDQRTPYLSIGATGYGKPILDRALRHETPMRTALKLAYLSFDSSRFSSSDVGYPIDVLTYNAADRTWREATFEYDDLAKQRHWWNQNITMMAHRFPDEPWAKRLVPPDLMNSPGIGDLSPSEPDH